MEKVKIQFLKAYFYMFYAVFYDTYSALVLKAYKDFSEGKILVID